MRKESCAIIEELLPLYLEDLCSFEVKKYVEEHLKTCNECSSNYEKMKADIHIELTERAPEKHILRYVNLTKVWYFICPLAALILLRFHMDYALYLYIGLLKLLSVIFISSEIFHKGAWWDMESVELQDEVRRKSKKRWGQFYTRPFLLAIPQLLVILVVELPRMIDFIKK